MFKKKWYLLSYFCLLKLPTLRQQESVADFHFKLSIFSCSATQRYRWNNWKLAAEVMLSFLFSVAPLWLSFSTVREEQKEEIQELEHSAPQLSVFPVPFYCLFSVTLNIIFMVAKVSQIFLKGLSNSHILKQE